MSAPRPMMIGLTDGHTRIARELDRSVLENAPHDVIGAIVVRMLLKMDGNEPSVWTCTTCGQTFASAAELYGHRVVAHPNGVQP